MSGMDSHLEVALASIKCFTDDGELDVGELNSLLGLAMRDGKIDGDEKRVLQNVFSKVGINAPARVKARIEEIKRKHGI